MRVIVGQIEHEWNLRIATREVDGVQGRRRNGAQPWLGLAPFGGETA